jgi:uncharacterized repeat protein (TIGR03806 family)
MIRTRTIALASCLVMLVAACADAPANSPAASGWTSLPQEPYRTLAEWKLFRDAAAQTPAEGVMPYAVNSPLFSDFTAKFRFVAVPAGRRITYRPDGAWTLPEGSVLVKTFSYPRDARDPSRGYRLLETRLLVRTRDGFIPHTYVWNEAQTEAIRQVAAPPVNVTWIDETGATRSNEYIIPNTNQCLTCHGQTGLTSPLAMRTDQLDRASPETSRNQLDDMVTRGWFDGTIPAAAMRVRFPDPHDESAPVERRARAYLHANCGHCHNPRDRSMASVTGLNLEVSEDRPSNLGTCRRPAMAGSGTGGFDYDVVPGHPERSILLFRMRTSDPRARMPTLGINFNDDFGASLVERWIREMPADTCGAM